MTRKTSANPWLKFLSNRYVLITLAFVIWMFFFDTNSYSIHKELNDEIDVLEQRKSQYQEYIAKDKAFIEQMSDTTEMEKYARSKYYLKKENETIYIIDHQDSTNAQDKK